MARTSYMPIRQIDQRVWSQNFHAGIAADPQRVGLTTAQAAAFGVVNGRVQTAWAANENAATRNRITVAEKNAALQAMRQMAADLVSIVQGIPTVTAAEKDLLGITVRSKHRTPSPVPTEAPLVQVKRVEGRSVVVRLLQARGGRGRPDRVAGATVFTHVGHHPPQPGQSWAFERNTTRTQLTLTFPPSASGDTVWVTAAWSNAVDTFGPASKPVSVNLPAGGQVALGGQTLRVAA